MPELTLHHFPGACSQVAVCALEQAGLSYELKLVNLAANAQAEPAYKAISPLGKVPALIIDGEVLTENAAIQIYIAALAPDAALFPNDPSPRGQADIVAGLAFCGGTLHPIVRGIANPSRMTTGDGTPVRERSLELADKSFGYAEQRLSEHGWWLGEGSIVDVYLNWAFGVACRAGYDASRFPQLTALNERLTERPAFRRMLEIEAESRIKLGL